MMRDIKADRAVVDAATPGPWNFDERDLTIRNLKASSCFFSNQMGDYHGCIMADLKPALGAESEQDLPAAKQARGHALAETEANARFIALAREALPYYMDAFEQAEAAREKAEGALEALAKAYMGAVTSCRNCPNRNPKVFGFNLCDKPCNESIKAWALAVAEKGVR